MIRILKVAPMEDCCLAVHLDNGSSIILSLASRLETVRFGRLADKTFFDRVTCDGSFIRWANEIEISVSELFQLAQK